MRLNLIIEKSRKFPFIIYLRLGAKLFPLHALNYAQDNPKPIFMDTSQLVPRLGCSPSEG